jgi:hypothetical protein
VTIRSTGLPCRLLRVEPRLRPYHVIFCACGLTEVITPHAELQRRYYPWRARHYATAWLVREAILSGEPDPVAHVERWLAEYPAEWLTAYARSQMET